MKNPEWPKKSLELTAKEKETLEKVYLDMQDWGYTGALGWVQNLGHKFAERLSHKSGGRTLEIGCGSGWHFQFVERKNYTGLDLRESLLLRARSFFPGVPLVQGDIYRLPFPDGSFDRAVSIYVFEHLDRLPECLDEVKRVLKKGGELLVGLPAEGGLAYALGRNLTTRRFFEKKYGVDYMRLVRHEHCNTFREVASELEKRFKVKARRYLPFFIPSVHLSAVVVLRCKRK